MVEIPMEGSPHLVSVYCMAAMAAIGIAYLIAR